MQSSYTPAYYCTGSLDASIVYAIFIASLRAVSCAAALAFAGLAMANLRMMSAALSKGLSQLSVKIAIPCLLFQSVVPGVSSDVLAYAWPLLLLPALYIFLGTLLGVLVLLIVDPPHDFRVGTVAACAFGNTTGIPLILLSVLQQSLSRSVFADLTDPVLFLSLQLVTYPVLNWLHSVLIIHLSTGLSMWRPRSVLYSDLPDSAGQSQLSRELPQEASAAPFDARSLTAAGDMVRNESSVLSFGTEFGSILAMHITDGDDSLQPRDVALRPLERKWSFGSWLATTFQNLNFGEWALRLVRRVRLMCRRVFVPSVVGVLLGALVGLYAKGLVLPPETAPLGWLYMGISKLGDAAVPINLILLGAALSRRPQPGALPPLTILGIVLARMVLMPLCGLLVAYMLAAYFSRLVLPFMTVDPFWLVILIVTCTPTANNIVVLCELTGENKHAMSAAIFYQYCAAPLLLPGVLTLFLAFICHARDVGLGLDGGGSHGGMEGGSAPSPPGAAASSLFSPPAPS